MNSKQPLRRQLCTESPIFDITDADLLPDDDDFSDDAYSLDPHGADFVDDQKGVSEGQPAAATQLADQQASSQKRRPQRADDKRSEARHRHRTEPAPDEVTDVEPVDLSAGVEVDVFDDEAVSDAAVPVIRRRRSGEEHSDPELPSRRGRSSKTNPPADDDESPDLRSGRKSNPRQLAILGGAGAVLLLGAFLYSHFSAPAAPTLPVVLDGPAPPAEPPSSTDGNDPEVKTPDEVQPEATANAEPDDSDDKPAPEGPEASNG